MNKSLLKDSLGWGLILWLIGYALSFLLFLVIPPSLIGWIIMPIGVALTILILLKKVRGTTLQYYFEVAIVWTLIAVAFDFVFIVKALKPVDGYYKPDVYLYYLLTFLLPLVVGWFKKSKPNMTSVSH